MVLFDVSNRNSHSVFACLVRYSLRDGRFNAIPVETRVNPRRDLGFTPSNISLCPHSGSDGGHTFHIVWHCSSAQALWNRVLVFWRRLGLWRWGTAEDNQRFLEAVFNLKLPSTPPGAWVYVAPQAQHDPQAADSLHELLQRLWTHHVLCCFHAIWAWRQGAGDSDTPWTETTAAATMESRFLAALQTSHVSKQAASTPGLRMLLVRCRELVRSPQPPQQLHQRPSDEYVLFFDGGSRGNPGPGGAGAVVVRIDALRTTASIIWSAAMSLASATTTNNQAEYFGLITGLAASRDRGWCPLHVVGDSALIIGQLRDRRPPKNVTRRRLYAAARHLADSLGELSWSHHLRSYNKMADTAANVAMDGRCSIQTLHPTDRSEWAGLHQHLEGDFSHWRESHCGPR